jgi:hypothetical protein
MHEKLEKYYRDMLKVSTNKLALCSKLDTDRIKRLKLEIEVYNNSISEIVDTYTTRINLLPFRGLRTSIYVGVKKGALVRNKLDLYRLDRNDDKIIFIIPSGTSTLGISFYKGLLEKSIERLGKDKFNLKYSFEITSKNETIRRCINRNLNDAKRYFKL